MPRDGRSEMGAASDRCCDLILLMHSHSHLDALVHALVDALVHALVDALVRALVSTTGQATINNGEDAGGERGNVLENT